MKEKYAEPSSVSQINGHKVFLSQHIIIVVCYNNMEERERSSLQQLKKKGRQVWYND